MNCMKCGRVIALGQVFCKECLADMDQYPIAPGTPVPLFDPDAVVAPMGPTNTRKQKKPDEQIITLKKWIMGLGIGLFSTILIFSIITGILVNRLQEAEKAPAAGQNYSSLDTTN